MPIRPKIVKMFHSLFIFSCKNNGICAGAQLYGNCRSNSDCFFGQYCNSDGKCVKSNKIGERCSSNEGCGRQGLCVYETTLSMYGTCKKLLSNSDETLILPMQKRDISEVDSNIFLFSSNMEKLCRSGAVNATSGKCKGQPLKSLNKVTFFAKVTLN